MIVIDPLHSFHLLFQQKWISAQSPIAGRIYDRNIMRGGPAERRLNWRNVSEWSDASGARGNATSQDDSPQFTVNRLVVAQKPNVSDSTTTNEISMCERPRRFRGGMLMSTKPVNCRDHDSSMGFNGRKLRSWLAISCGLIESKHFAIA
jgi:hypothetical protein